jgi:hypothetical protein
LNDETTDLRSGIEQSWGMGTYEIKFNELIIN